MPDTRSYPYSPTEKKGLPSIKAVAELLPGVGDALSMFDAAQAAKKGDYTGAALSGLAALPFIPGIVTSGIRKGRPLFHGTSNDPDAVKAILREGYKKGGSAELHIPGTSLAANPSVSMFKFGGDPDSYLLVNKLKTDVPVYNLRPSEYLTTFLEDGRSLADIKSSHVVGTPRSYYDETEVFVPEKMRPAISPRTPTEQEVKSLTHEYGRKYIPFRSGRVHAEAAFDNGFLPGTAPAKAAKPEDALRLANKYREMRHPNISEFKAELLQNGSYPLRDKLAAFTETIGTHPVAKRVQPELRALNEAVDRLDVMHMRYSQVRQGLEKYVNGVIDESGRIKKVVATPTPEEKRQYEALRRAFDESYKELRSAVNDAATKYEAFVSRLPESLLRSRELRKHDRVVHNVSRALPTNKLSFIRGE